jgi:hypothetical protein
MAIHTGSCENGHHHAAIAGYIPLISGFGSIVMFFIKGDSFLFDIVIKSEAAETFLTGSIVAGGIKIRHRGIAFSEVKSLYMLWVYVNNISWVRKKYTGVLPGF